MANDITNRLRLEGEQDDINKVFDFIKATEPNNKGKLEFIDFNKLVPMPQELLNNGGWYDWRNANWGTKWNAYHTEKVEGENTIFFLTAWGGVPELMNLLASKFPNVTFYYDYASEDIGYHVGSWKFKGNEGWCTPIKEDSKEAYELCFDLGNCDKDMFEFLNGTYKWKDEED